MARRTLSPSRFFLFHALLFMTESEVEHTVDFAPGFFLHATSSPPTMFDLRHAHPQTLIFVTLAHTGLRSKKNRALAREHSSPPLTLCEIHFHFL